MSNDIAIRLTADASSADRALRATGNELQALDRNLEATRRASESLTGSLARMGHAASIGLGVRELAGAADAWSTLNARLALVSGGAASAAVAYGRVLDIAMATRTSLEGVGQIYERFARQSAQLGISTEQIAGLTTTVAQAMAVSGASAQTAEAALTQFGQALSSGVLRGEELNSILEQAPRLAQALADGLGVPVGKLRELGEAGEITSQKLVQALGSQAQALAAEFARMPVTVGGALANLQTQWVNTIGSLEQSTGAFRSLAGGIQLVAENLNSLVGAGLAGLAVGLGRTVGAATAAGTAMVANAIATERASAATVTNTLMNTRAASALTGTALAARAASGALALVGGPVGLITTALALGATAWMVWGDSAKQAADKARDAAREAADEAARLGLTELEVARNKRDTAQAKWSEAGQSASDPNRADFVLWDNRVRELEQREKNLANAAAKAGATASQKWSDFYASQTEKRAADIAKLDALYVREATAARDNQTRQLELAGQYRTKLAEINASFDKKVGAKPGLEVSPESLALAKDYGAAFEKLIGLETRAVTATQQLNAAEQLRADLITSGVWERMPAAWRAELEAKLKSTSATLDAAEETKAWIKAQEAAQQALTKETEGYEEQIRQLTEHNAAIGLSVEQLGELKLARIDATIAAKEQALATLDAKGQCTAETEALREQIAALRQIRGLTQSGQVAQGAADAAQSALRDWQRMTEQVGQSLTDELMRGGKNAGEMLESLARTWILRPSLQVVGTGIAGGTMNAISAGLGLGGGPQAGFNATSLLGGITGVSGLASGVMAAGQFLGSAGIANFGAGMYAGATGGFSAAGAIGANAGATSAAGIGSTIGAAMPYIAAAVIAYEMLATKRTPHVGGFAQVDANGNVLTNDALRNRTVINGHRAVGLGGTDFRTSDFSQQGTEAATSLAKGSSAILEGIARSFGLAGGFTVGTGFADDSSKDGAWGGLRIQRGGQDLVNWSTGFGGRGDFADGAAGFAQYQGELAKSIRGVLDDMDLPGWADGMLAQLGASASLEDLTKTVDAINQTNAALVTLRPAFTQLGITSDEVILKLVEGMGGLQNASGAIGSYIDAIYTPAEKLTMQQGQLKTAFDALGYAVPTTREAFRQLVEGFDLTTEAGRAAYGAVIGLAPAWAQLTDAANTTTTAVDTTADSLRRIADEARGLQDRLDELTLTPAQLIGKQRAALDPANQGLFDQVQAAELGRTNTSWQERIDLAAGTITQRALDRQHDLDAAVDDTTRGLINRYYDQLDANDAAAEAARAMEAQQRAAEQAAQASARAAEEQQRAAEQLIESWQRVTDTLADTVRDLRGDLVGQGASGYAYLQSQFALDTAAARAGDQTAAQRLPEWVRGIADIAGEVSTTSLERDRIIAQATASLEATIKGFSRIGVTVPAFAVGTNFVPGDMLAQVHQGERIIPAADNRLLIDLMRGGGNAEELRVLRDELRAMTQALDARLARIEKSSGDTADRLGGVILTEPA